MTQKNIDKLETMAQDFLQYRFKVWLLGGERDADRLFYEGACKMIEAFGGTWQRKFKGGDENDIKNYFHKVYFPDNRMCESLIEDAWKD